MASERWQRKRNSYRRWRPWRCAACGTTKDLDLHHRTYARLGAERLDDLIPLCGRHHKALHRYAHRNRLPVSVATAAYLASARRRKAA